MISVRLRLEIPTPTAEGVKPLPEGAKELVIAAFREVIPRCIKKIDIDGETYEVYASQRTTTTLGVGFRLLGATQDFAKSTTVTLFVDIVDQPGEEPSK